ncbi:hypothetical protein [Actinoplanes flavus]|uniref:Uncharacterized protein n=1 Tax=Actinoplanes flavus TaxID=2820290 RepID=A0ABS3UZK8_9ACTN|nr:hypothetical protein [Actinoplanes flavus]MBO3743976.1 hypothetical protein [Actinoplanes flavus]
MAWEKRLDPETPADSALRPRDHAASSHTRRTVTDAPVQVEGSTRADSRHESAYFAGVDDARSGELRLAPIVHNYSMAMSESFAATAAQTIPVLALAATLEYRASSEQGRGYMLAFLLRKHGRKSDKWRTGRSGLIGGLAAGIWTTVMFACIPAEGIAVYRLQGHYVGTVGENFTGVTIVAAMALLVFYPIIMRIADSLEEVRYVRRDSQKSFKPPADSDVARTDVEVTDNRSH